MLSWVRGRLDDFGGWAEGRLLDGRPEDVRRLVFGQKRAILDRLAMAGSEFLVWPDRVEVAGVLLDNFFSAKLEKNIKKMWRFRLIF